MINEFVESFNKMFEDFPSISFDATKCFYVLTSFSYMELKKYIFNINEPTRQRFIFLQDNLIEGN